MWGRRPHTSLVPGSLSEKQIEAKMAARSSPGSLLAQTTQITPTSKTRPRRKIVLRISAEQAVYDIVQYTEQPEITHSACN